MNPQSLGAHKVWGVRELVNYLSRKITSDDRLRGIEVRGEVSNYSPRGGIVYFALKEPSGVVLNCVVMRDHLRALPPLRNGLEAVAYGSVALYDRGSQYQLLTEAVRLLGAGVLAEAYERMKRKLAAEGLFDPARKRPIPHYPFRIALVSSADGQGTQDVMRKLHEEVPYVKIRLFATPVQGPNAAPAIAEALRRASNSSAQVIALVRGGGSDEDRLPFNEEVVARAIVASRVPVVTGIGHQTDHHIADDVADLEAFTPTDAAKRLSAFFVALPDKLHAARERMRSSVNARIAERRARLRRLQGSVFFQNFRRSAHGLEQQLSHLQTKLEHAQAAVLRARVDALRPIERRLQRFDPSAVLAVRRRRLSEIRDALPRRWAAGVRVPAERELRARRERLAAAWAGRFRLAQARLDVVQAKLGGKNPAAILQQGYAIVRFEGRALRDAAEVGTGALVEAQLSRGTLVARVEKTERDA